MKERPFQTRITRMLGIRYPLLAGGLGPGVSDATYVAAVAKAGGMGFIVASGFPDKDAFREQLRTCKELAQGRPFGVNLYISRQSGAEQRLRAQIDVLLEEGVPCVETAGASPQPVIDQLKGTGVRVLHKVPAVRYAQAAARMGVDAVIVVGNDCGGHPGTYGIGTMVQTPHAAQQIDLPLVVGGGIGCGSQLAAALAMGADAVILGTRLLVAQELWIHADYKERIVQGNGTESVIVKRALRDHHRVLDNLSAQAVAALDAAGELDFEKYRPHVSGSLSMNAYRTGDTRHGMLDYGPAAVFADRIEPVKDIFGRIIREAQEATARLCRLSAVDASLTGTIP